MRTRQLALVAVGALIALFALIVSHTASGDSLATLYDDEFDTGQLNARWSWFNEDPTRWSLTAAPGNLRITATGNDMVPACGSRAVNLLVQDASTGNFELLTKVAINPTQNFQQAVLLIFSDVNNYVKTEVAWNGQDYDGQAAALVLVEGGQISSQRPWFNVDLSQPAFLKLSKSGNRYTGSYSADGQIWRSIGTITTNAIVSPKVGITAYTSCYYSPPDIPADFDFFRVSSLPDEWAVRTYNTDDAGGAFVNGVMVAGSMYSYYPDSGYLSANEFWRAGSDNFVSFASWDAGVCCYSSWGFALRRNGTEVWNTTGGGPTGERIAYAHMLQASKDGVVTDFNQIAPSEKLPGRWYVRVRASGGSAFALIDKLPVAGSTWNQANLVEITQWLGKRNNTLHLNAWNDGGGSHQWSFAILKDGVTLWQVEDSVTTGDRARSMYKQLVIDESGNVFEGAPPTPDLSLAGHRVGEALYGVMLGQPDQTRLGVQVQNIGNADAHDVIVDFYDGPPNTGQWVGSWSTDVITAGATVTAGLTWTAGQAAEIEAYARARLTAGQEANLENNISVGQRIRTWHAINEAGNFRYDPDTFHFENPPLTFEGFQAEVLDYILAAGALPQPIPAFTWRNVIGPWLYAWLARTGHCFGMSQASIMFWDLPSERPGGKATYVLEPSEAASAIRDHQARQLVVLFESELQHSDARTSYAALLKRIKDQQRPAIVTLRQGSNGTMHAVTAYKIVEVGDRKHVFFYDSNHPMTEATQQSHAQVATFDVAANTLQYGDYNRAYVSDPILALDEAWQKALLDGYQWFLRQIIRGGKIRVVMQSNAADSPTSDGVAATTDATASILVVDQQGRRVGFVDGTPINEIPEATLEAIADGMYAIDVPADLVYSVTTRGAAPGTMDLAFLLPLDQQQVREVIYAEVVTAAGAQTTTHLSRGTVDWTMDLGGGQTRTPSLERVVDVAQRLFLPIVTR